MKGFQIRLFLKTLIIIKKLQIKYSPLKFFLTVMNANTKNNSTKFGIWYLSFCLIFNLKIIGSKNLMMLFTALFIIARTWKQPRCPSADEWIRKLWYIYTMEYYSAIKKNTFESVLMRWMKLESIIQSEVSQKDKHQCSILMHIYGI